MQSLRICFVGDSLVNGTGDPACLGWTGRVCAAACDAGHDITYYNLGIRRATSADIHGYWRDEVTRRLPEGIAGRVVFSFGVNDATELDGSLRVPQETTLNLARAVLTDAQRTWPVLLVGPTPVLDTAHNRRIVHLSDGLAALAAEMGVAYLPVFEVLSRSGVWLDEVRRNDGAHPRARGYAELAQCVQSWPAWREGLA
jgi:lysophospholipase L1-like esterase